MTLDFERMAMFGSAPAEGCRLFGIGYETAFERLRKTFINGRMARGGSAEKFIVGPYGSGKTHFLRTLMEIGRSDGVVTAEVMANKEVDLTQSLIVYREITDGLRAPNQEGRGMEGFLRACVEKVGAAGEESGNARLLQNAWVKGVRDLDFRATAYGRVAHRALSALLDGDRPAFENASRWLAGEIGNRALAKELDVDVVPKPEQSLAGRRMTLSLCQLARSAGFAGTIIGFDEAEQGMDVDKRRLNRILSMVRSSVDAAVDLEGGSALIVWAVTPSTRENINQYPALQTRLESKPGFFDGNTLAPIIDLTERREPEQELRRIGIRLLELYLEQNGPPDGKDEGQLRDDIERAAREIYEEDPSAQSRRPMVKRTCTILLGYDAAPMMPEEGEV